ncbi:MAG: hypothetical protein HGA99_03125 [Chlorobiaceae bacterium]|nr:hypothetical protein [Chlorobiaceae bacterium]
MGIIRENAAQADLSHYNQALQQGSFVLHPNQFQVNEAWIVFKLNDEPIHTVSDGDFDFFALMDAASCFLLASSPVLSSMGELTRLDAKRMLKQGKAHKNKLPKTLLVPEHHSTTQLMTEAESQGITVIQVPENQLLPFIGEAREGFKERFG